MVLFQGRSKGEGAEKAPRSIFFKGWAFLQKVNLVTRARGSLWKESGALGKSPKECTGIHCTITIGSSTLGKRAMFTLDFNLHLECSLQSSDVCFEVRSDNLQ